MEQSSLTQPSTDSLPGARLSSGPGVSWFPSGSENDFGISYGRFTCTWGLCLLTSCGLPYDPIPVCSCLQGAPFYYLIFITILLSVLIATVLKDLTTFGKYV